MKICKIVVALFVIITAQLASGAQGDTLLLYPDGSPAFDPVTLQDTVFDTVDYYYHIHAEADTGDTFRGYYMNWDYQLANGWAASKITWNNGNAIKDIYSVAYQNANFFFDHDSLVFYYKGPLPAHNMTVSFVSSQDCGGTPYYYKIGTVLPHSTWTRAALALPDSVDTIQGIRELDFVIHNIDTVGGSSTSDTGNVKLDNIMLIKPNPPSPTPETTKEKSKCGCGSGTGLALIPPIWFKVMSNRKRKKKNQMA